MPPVGKNLERLRGIVDGDGIRDSSLYFDGHTLVVDALGRDANSPALRVRGLDARNVPTDLLVVNKDGSLVWAGLGPTVNVKAYGAKGDDATDDTAAVQAAIDALPAAGGTVFFPVGIYRVTGVTITDKEKIALKGEGISRLTNLEDAMPGSVLRNTHATNDLLTITGTTTIVGFLIRDLSFQGGPASGTATGGHGIKLTNVNEMHMQNVQVVHCRVTGKAGLALDAVNRIDLLGCYFYNNDTGVKAIGSGSGGQIGDFRMFGGASTQNAGAGVELYGSMVSFFGVDLEGQGYGFRSGHTTDHTNTTCLQFYGCHFEACNDAGVKIGATRLVTGLTIQGCHFLSNTVEPDHFVDVVANDFMIAGNVFAGTQDPAFYVKLTNSNRGWIGPNSGLTAALIQDGTGNTDVLSWLEGKLRELYGQLEIDDITVIGGNIDGGAGVNVTRRSNNSITDVIDADGTGTGEQWNVQANSVDRFAVKGEGNVVVGSAALSTLATNGFLYIPTMAGSPAGTPTAFSGRVALVFDTVNNQLCVYDGSWLKVTLA